VVLLFLEIDDLGFFISERCSGMDRDNEKSAGNPGLSAE